MWLVMHTFSLEMAVEGGTPDGKIACVVRLTYGRYSGGQLVAETDGSDEITVNVPLGASKEHITRLVRRGVYDWAHANDRTPCQIMLQWVD